MGKRGVGVMADISMCSGAGCPLKEKCYRYTAPKSEMQTHFSPPRKKDGSCNYFWPVVKANEETDAA